MKPVDILLPGALTRPFTYAVPEDMALQTGSYVRISLGNREVPGVVWGDSDGAGKKLKPVLEHYAHLPPMGEHLQEFVRFCAWYNTADIGAVLKMCIPVAEALKPPTAREKHLAAPHAHPSPPRLSADQQTAATQLAAALDNGFSATLLDGITGSGKTEVYFDMLERVTGYQLPVTREATSPVTGNRKLVTSPPQALVLLPEISLSIQWLERFEKRFGFQPVVWHSGLPPGARKAAWRAIVQGEAPVVVGARSALFLPYRNLRAIVVDEEHDGSYKQEDGVIYHARDMAVARAAHEKIPVVLVSATPSLETHYNVQTGKYRAVHLHARHAGAQLPDISMVDMRRTPLERGAFLSDALRKALADTLASGHQSLLFLNRRGYAPLTLCRACGHRFQCPLCTAWLVMHRRITDDGGQMTRKNTSSSAICHPSSLQCHHCGYKTPTPPACPECQSTETLFPCGPGVERIAEEVAAFLPQARLEVLASDSTESHEELQARIRAMQEGEVDILIGTQMVAKGHHFGKLALVGVVDADLGLAGGDLRAAERTYQLLHQVSGRAGRESAAGRVLVQSFCPEHPVLQALLAGDRDAFLQLELEERERGRLPPFFRLAAIIVESPNEEQAALHAKKLARSAPQTKGIQVLGPAPAPLYRLRGKFRQRLLVRAERQLNVQDWLNAWVEALKTPGSVRVKIDIDPQAFL